MPSNPTWGVGSKRAANAFAASRRGGGISPSTLIRCALFGCVTVCTLTVLYFTVAILRQQSVSSDAGSGSSLLRSLSSAAQHRAGGANDDASRLRAAGGAVAASTPRPRVIVLSDGEGRWNTGVWPGWGYGPLTTLNWAAAGVVIPKQCPVACTWTREQGEAATADAVIMELVNAPKFGVPHSVPIPYPSRRPHTRTSTATQLPPRLPLLGLFYFEPASAYPDFTLANPDVAAAFDFSLTPSRASQLQVTLTCPWGKKVPELVAPPPVKSSSRFMAYFNEHGVAGEYRGMVNELFDAAGPDALHAYVHMRNRDMPAEAGGNPYALATRLAFMGTYKFILVTEAVVEADWVEPDLSHVWAAGSVPVYLGAPNVHAFIPGPRAFVHGRKFKSGKELWDYLSFFNSDSKEAASAYAEFFAWKERAHEVLMLDEGGQDAPLGTGQGLVRDQMPHEELLQQLAWWDVTSDRVSLAEAARQVPPGSFDFDTLSRHAWRNFRRQLDHCVHFAECRICELVTLLT